MQSSPNPELYPISGDPYAITPEAAAGIRNARSPGSPPSLLTLYTVERDLAELAATLTTRLAEVRAKIAALQVARDGQ